MPIIGVKVSEGAKIVRQGLQNLADQIPKVGRQGIYNALRRSKARLKKPGAPVEYPIKWDNPKQKIKVIIMLKETDNLPYKRTNLYETSFEIIKTKEGYDLVTDHPSASFIGGDADGLGQSNVTKGRYPVIRHVVDEEIKKIPDEVHNHLDIINRQKGLA